MAYDPNNIADRKALSESLKTMLAKAGFKLTPGVGEEVYEFPFPHLAHTRVLVYSTIVGGAVRGDGEDAIRVAAVYTCKDGSTRGLFKDTRVNRTGEVDKIVERTLGRMRNAYVALKQRKADGKVCRHCGSPLFTSKGGNEVCADACWAKNKKAA